jgi:uncharacterized protein YbbC (DUF1343 family)
VSVSPGLDLLINERIERVKGRRVGLLCHPASVAADLTHSADRLAGAGVQLHCLFGPEHGVRGEAQDMIGVSSDRDPRLGVPVHSLYGATLESLSPRAEWLEDLDVVLIDVQDVGSRYYTYVWTMVLTIRACAAAGVEVVVLDRPNPLGGVCLEGPLIEPGFDSFVGLHPVPVRHGMTPGEIALLVAHEQKIEAEVSVVPARGWRREWLFDRTGLPWVLPSPNMPTLETALVYPGGCLLEGTTLSEGRGTTRPFEIFGAPWVDGWALAEALHAEDLPGVRFRPTTIRPTFHKHQDLPCGAVQIHVTDRRRFRPLRTYVAVLLALGRLWPGQFEWRRQPYEFVSDLPAIDLLAGGSWLREGVERRVPLAELCQGWASAEEAFAERRRPFLIYPEGEG